MPTDLVPNSQLTDVTLGVNFYPVKELPVRLQANYTLRMENAGTGALPSRTHPNDLFEALVQANF